MSSRERFLEFMDTQPLTFGKYKGTTPEQLCKSDPGYVEWLRKEVKPKVVSYRLYLEACAKVDAMCSEGRT